MPIELPEVWPDWLDPLALHRAIHLWLGPFWGDIMEGILAAVLVAALVTRFVIVPCRKGGRT